MPQLENFKNSKKQNKNILRKPKKKKRKKNFWELVFLGHN